MKNRKENLKMENESQSADNLKKISQEDPPVSRPATSSVKNLKDEPGLNQNAIDNNKLDPSDLSDN